VIVPRIEPVTVCATPTIETADRSRIASKGMRFKALPPKYDLLLCLHAFNAGEDYCSFVVLLTAIGSGSNSKVKCSALCEQKVGDFFTSAGCISTVNFVCNG
jgi:hypothetical protein